MTAPHKYNTPEALERHRNTLETADRIVEYLELRKLKGEELDFEITEISNGSVSINIYVPSTIFLDVNKRSNIREAVKDIAPESVYVQAIVRVGEVKRTRIFPNGVNVSSIRIARPTHQLKTIVEFYQDALGLPFLGSFENHAGYDGVMLGLPDSGVHLEFTQHSEGQACPAPSKDNLMVLYVSSQADLTSFQISLEAHGHLPVEPENPYWLGKSLTFEDPDGWRVVIFDTSNS